LHLFDLLEQQAGPATGRATLDIGRAEPGEAGEHQLADGLAHRTARLDSMMKPCSRVASNQACITIRTP